jgi:hypothetical protein
VESVAAHALLTSVIVGLIRTAVFGLMGTDISPDVSFGTFSTLVTLFAHSMMMFYLIGKGKAVKDAMIACGAIACNVQVMKIEIPALAESSRIVDEGRRLLGA